MQPLKLSDICRAMEAPSGGMTADREITKIAIDSRTVSGGELFWALKGQRHDGHEFVEQALRAGAAAAVVRRDFAGPEQRDRLVAVADTLAALGRLAGWYRRRMPATVVGVTGSVGKTSTREMIDAVLKRHLPGTQSPRSYNNSVGVPLSVLQIEAEHRYAVVELGTSRPGEIAALAVIARPNIGVMTCIGEAHLDGLGDLAGVARAKGELLEALPADGTAVLNGDDPWLRQIASRAPCKVIWVGSGADCSLRATQVEPQGTRLRFVAGGQRFEMPAVGRHHVQGALLALAVGGLFGLTLKQMAGALADYEGPPMRCQLAELHGVAIINDAYNANPLSMRAAVEALRDWPTDGRRVLLVGDMLELGTEARVHHERLGRVVAQSKIDAVIAVGELSRSLIAAARSEGMSAERARHADSIADAADWLAGRLRPGDVLLVKGSRAMGMERAIDLLRAQREMPRAA